MRVGVIGAGNWGKNIIRDLADLGALAAICEPTPDKLAAYAAAYPGVAAFTEAHALLQSDVDAVMVVTPTPTHCRIARAALTAGKDVYVEKPLTHDSASAQELVQLAAARGCLLMVGHLLLYQPAIAWIKDYLAGGKLGDLFSVRHERLTLGRARPLESVLWDIGVHDVAVMLHLIGGAPRRIRASGHHMLQLGVEDEVQVHLEFGDGVRGDLHVSWLWPETTRRTIVRGSRGMLVYDEVAQTVTLHRKWIDADLSNCDQGSEVVHRGHGQPLRLELQHFLDRIQDRRRPLSDGHSALVVIETLERVSAALSL